MEEYSKSTEQRRKSFQEQFDQAMSEIQARSKQIDQSIARSREQSMAEMQKQAQQSPSRANSTEFERRIMTETEIQKSNTKSNLQIRVDEGATSDSGNNYFSRNLNCNPKLEFPKFDGRNPRIWINKCSTYFELCEISKYQQVKLASLYMIDKAESWMASYMSWLFSNKDREYVDWMDFIIALNDRFRVEVASSFWDQFEKLQQHDTLETYIDDFENLRSIMIHSNRMFPPDDYLIDSFIDGLKPAIKGFVRSSKPVTITSAMEIARQHDSLYKIMANSELQKQLKPQVTSINRAWNEFPTFDGSNTRMWINECEKFFAVFSIPYYQRAKMASLHMFGRAETWFELYQFNRRYVIWEEMIADLLVRFKDDFQVSSSTHMFQVCETGHEEQGNAVEDVVVQPHAEIVVHLENDQQQGQDLKLVNDAELVTEPCISGPNEDIVDYDCVVKAVVGVIEKLKPVHAGEADPVVVPKLEKERIGAADEATVEVVAFVTVENKVEEAVPKLAVEVVETTLVVGDAADATFANPIKVVKTDAGEFSSIVARGFNTVQAAGTGEVLITVDPPDPPDPPDQSICSEVISVYSSEKEVKMEANKESEWAEKYEVQGLLATYFFVDGVSIIEDGRDGGRSLWNYSEYNLQFQNGWKEKPLPWRDKIELVLEVDASFKVFSHSLLSYALQLVELIPTYAEKFVVEMEAILEANTGIFVAYGYASLFDFHTSHSAVKIFDPGGLSFVIEMVKAETVAQFGAIVLFALGLDFSTAKLRVVQAVAVMGGLFKIFSFMYLCGLTASLCGGKPSEGVFVGAFLSMPSAAVVLSFLMEKYSVNALPVGFLTSSAMFRIKWSTKEVDEQMIKSFSHELNFKGVRPFPLWKPQRMNTLEEVWVMIRAKFDKAKEEVDSDLRVFAVHRVETLDKNVESHLEWQETIADLLVMVWSCAMTSGREFWLQCESIIQELDDRRQDHHMGILKQLHTRMLFILSRYTKLLQFHKESGVFEDEHALTLHQSFHIVSLFCIAGLCTAVGLIKLRKEEIMQLVHDLGEEFQALGKPVREFDMQKSIHSFFYKAAELCMVGLTDGTVQGASSYLVSGLGLLGIKQRQINSLHEYSVLRTRLFSRGKYCYRSYYRSYINMCILCIAVLGYGLAYKLGRARLIIVEVVYD